ncbi:hypothetical protein [Archaeoglobus profundus]|uniref:Uncharacterized protein n=1 Tax=Archaeoglobus profundus (strain DSM 5631 / JCM 9629 / NBRC 100127 / Av18) TaxID=572546 RepID=D2RDM0_ARCPA|nr:hypothetical protein [Archaeoglobus profundus]ADB58214.1 hypothetical protein Arcpr_1159 [Archaeoglobus profundus DSM 5631]
MIALIGYTRFPVFYSSDGKKVLGCKCNDKEFRDYVWSIKDKGAVAIRTLSKLNLRRRFVVKDKAINPSLRTVESVVRRIYVYPSYEAVEPITNAYVLGFTLKFIRMPVFVPLIVIRYLEEGEVEALLGIAKVREINIDEMVEFLRSLGIQVEVRSLVEGIVVDLDDPIVGCYQVLIDEQGRVIDTNVCIDMEAQLFLPELVFLIRQQGNIYIYPRKW